MSSVQLLLWGTEEEVDWVWSNQFFLALGSKHDGLEGTVLLLSLDVLLLQSNQFVFFDLASEQQALLDRQSVKLVVGNLRIAVYCRRVSVLLRLGGFPFRKLKQLALLLHSQRLYKIQTRVHELFLVQRLTEIFHFLQKWLQNLHGFYWDRLQPYCAHGYLVLARRT